MQRTDQTYVKIREGDCHRKHFAVIFGASSLGDQT